MTDDDKDKEDKARREASRDQLNTILGKHGWKLGTVRMIAPAAVEYGLVRTDGRVATHRMLLSDLLMVGSDDVLEKVNLLLALHLLVLVKRENAKHPIVEKTT